MKRIILFIFIWIGLVGCTKAPALKVYSVEVPSVEVIARGKYRNQSIKVTFPQSLKEQMSQKMNFSYSTSDRGTYQNSEWSNNMSKLLQGVFIEVLERSRLFKVVLSDTTTLKENYRLESNIFVFEHQVRGSESHANLSVQFTLINADIGRLVKSKRFSYQEPTQTTDAQGYAHATNKALHRLSQDVLKWIQ